MDIGFFLLLTDIPDERNRKNNVINSYENIRLFSPFIRPLLPPFDNDDDHH